MWIQHYSVADEHLDCLQFGVFVSNAAAEIVVCVFWGIRVPIPILYILRNGIPESLGDTVSASRYCQFPRVSEPVYTPTSK